MAIKTNRAMKQSPVVRNRNCTIGAFSLSVVGTLMFLLFIIPLYTSNTLDELFNVLSRPDVFYVLMLGCPVIGLVLSVASYVRQEPPSFIKYLALCVNAGLVLLTLIAIIS